MELIQLVTEAQQGNQESLGEVCRRFSGLVKKQAFQHHLRPVAEDAQAQAWVAVIEAVKAYNSLTGVPVEAYVESRVKYALWNLFKKERRRWRTETALEIPSGSEDCVSFVDTLADTADVAGEVERRQMFRLAVAALETLPARQRLAVLYTTVQGMKLHEAASRLGVSIQAVHSLRQRGLRALKANLV